MSEEIKKEKTQEEKHKEETPEWATRLREAMENLTEALKKKPEQEEADKNTPKEIPVPEPKQTEEPQPEEEPEPEEKPKKKSKGLSWLL